MDNGNRKRLILIELNEINFDIVQMYLNIDAARYPSFRKLLAGSHIRTTSEKQYEELEPWIQWPSVHTSSTFAEHGVFRLGDIVGSCVPQIFEELEQSGYKVGVISAMNAENRLKMPAYFIPDPWTQTPPDKSWWSQSLSQAVSQAVNDNAKSRITAKSALSIFLGLLRFARVKNYRKYLYFVLLSWHKPWLKSMILDLFLHDFHWSMFNAKRPHFSTIFFNAGAHIQHHYFFNAEPLGNNSSSKNPTWYVRGNQDPLADVLQLYDIIVGEYFSRTDTEVVLATGLSQKPYDRAEFYYRLNSHADFLHRLGIKFKRVIPRMTRDFLIEFDTEEQSREAKSVLSGIRVVGEEIALFGDIDNRGKSIFVTLTYSKEIFVSTKYQVGSITSNLFSEVSFVAIKNGMHQDEGFVFFTPGVSLYAPLEKSHVAQVGVALKRYFDLIG